MREEVELRSPRDPGEEKVWHSFMHYAFEPEKPEEQWWERMRKIRQTEAQEKLGWYRGDELIATCGLIPFRSRLRGGRIPVGGITAVATPPENRFRGHARSMLRELLVLMRDRGIYTSALWPFYTGFYAAMGWAVSAEYCRFKFTVEDMRRLTSDFTMNREFEKFAGDDASPLNRVYSAWAEGYDLSVERGENWWQTRVLTLWDRKPYVYLCRDSSGAPAGYIVYFIEGDWKTRSLVVEEMAYTDLDTYRAMLRYVAGHVSQVKEYVVTVPSADPLWDWHLSGEVARRRGIMFRITDVRRALEALPCPESVSGAITVSVTDDFASWNEGTFRLEMEGGAVSLASGGGEPDLEIDIGALSRLYCGYRSIDQLLANGSVRSARSEVRDTLARVFPPRNIYMMEEF
ncbi:MAG: GNAT family N-acetyltransferase [Bacillota bacterium]